MGIPLQKGRIALSKEPGRVNNCRFQSGWTKLGLQTSLSHGTLLKFSR
jgi:hypothetical protein